jgi:hypothetical protein
MKCCAIWNWGGGDLQYCIKILWEIRRKGIQFAYFDKKLWLHALKWDQNKYHSKLDLRYMTKSKGHNSVIYRIMGFHYVLLILTHFYEFYLIIKNIPVKFKNFNIYTEWWMLRNKHIDSGTWFLCRICRKNYNSKNYPLYGTWSVTHYCKQS